MQPTNPIPLRDNSQHQITKLSLDEAQLNNVRHLASCPIAELIKKCDSNLLIFPQDINQGKDSIGSSRIIRIDESTIYTGNIMGFVGYKNTRLRIYSRFAQADNHDFFIHYLLQKVFAVNLFDLKYTSNRDSIFDFLIYLFPAFLKRAMSQGLYREYQTKNYNDSNVRGRIDISRHIRQNIPFTGKIAYSSREYTADNAVTQLIRHTIDYISHHSYCGNILQNDEETKRNVAQIIAATNSTYNYRDRQRVINQNLRAIRHPYFSEYSNLQKICMQILRHEELKYGTKNDEIYGILFDGAWLWEEYLAIVLKDVMTHYTQKNSHFHLFRRENNTTFQQIVPDFYNSKLNIVADAKYVPLQEQDKLNGDQALSIYYKTVMYMYRFNCPIGFLIYPASNFQQEELYIEGKKNEVLYKIGLKIPQKSEKWNVFREEMGKSEKNILTFIKELKFPI